MENGNLVLSRKTGESVMIGQDIKVTVKAVRGNKVRLSFSVPKETLVHRLEIFNEIKKQNEEACQAKADARRDALKNMVSEPVDFSKWPSSRGYGDIGPKKDKS